MERRSSPFARIALAIVLASCGNKGDASVKAKDDAASGPQVAPLPTPISGVDSIKRMNFVYGEGWPAYDKAEDALKAKKPDEARKYAETAVAKDPYHLDAHYLLARLLAQSGEHAAVVDHVVTALAGDYLRYGKKFLEDKDLAEFRATAHGEAVKAVAIKLRDDYAKRIPTGIWLVARRSSFKWPKDPGVQAATSRGEVYAYDRETKRYLRLTHTDHKVVGFLRAPSGNAVAIVGFDKIDRPKLPEEPATFGAVWLQVLDTKEWQAVGPKIALGAQRAVEVGYGDNDQLLITTTPTAGAASTSTVDTSTGKLTKGSAAPAVPRLALTLDAGQLVRAADGVLAAWSGEPPTATSLKTAAGGTIAIPESGAVTQASVAVAPGGARVAFVTAVDPCAKDTAPSLYVADAKTGTFKHVLTARSRFGTHWIDPNLIAYEDGEGGIRVWDASIGREAVKLENKPGIALDALSLAAAPVCKQAPAVVDPIGTGSGSADEPPLPPEEPAGPVTTPAP
ncbi:MAG: hypothetical protein JWP01_3190 [Myxococcales bacterium]|nr:hypothetical protein [Myxococcales bacterium]